MANKLGIGILVRDHREHASKSISINATVLKRYGMSLHVFDNSVKEDLSDIVKKHDNIIYHKQTKDLCYEDHLLFAINEIKDDYVWIFGQKVILQIGAIPLVLDYLKDQNYSLILANCNARLSMLGLSHFVTNLNEFMATEAWHCTLLGSTIYNRKTIEKAEIDRYRGKDFIHLAIALDGITKGGDAILSITHPVTTTIYEKEAAWMPRFIEIWTKDLWEVVSKLPEVYSEDAKVAFCNNNNFCGALFTDNQMRYLARNGYLTHEILDEFMPNIKRFCHVPEARLRYIVETDGKTAGIEKIYSKNLVTR